MAIATKDIKDNAKKDRESMTSFLLSGEYFCFGTMKILHILKKVDPTNVPLSKDYILGVINNHGSMVPVVNTSRMFGLKETGNHPEASIIIISTDDSKGDSLLGFLVDEVDEVFYYDESNFKSDVLFQIDNAFQPSLMGTISHNGKFIYCINVPELAKEILK